MVTGGQVATARAIARQIGLVHPDEEDVAVLRGSDIPPADQWDEAFRDQLGRTRVFARTEPRQKLDLIALAQSAAPWSA
jgi:Ca2+-transporting ATPase